MRNKIVSILLVATLGMGCIACGDTKADTNSTTSNTPISSKETDNDTTVESESSIDESLFKYEELEDGNIAVWGYEGEVEDLVIPETIDGKTVEVIGYGESESGFVGAQIKSIVIPNTVRRINKESFIGSSLESIILGNGVEEIYDYSFGTCFIKEITIPASVKYMGYAVFSNIPTLSKVVFEGDVETLDNSFGGLAEEVTFYGPSNSNVQALADKMGYNFVAQ